MTFIPSIFQVEIFKEVKQGSRHLVVEALAGSGKTTTLIKSLDYLPSLDSTFLGAFNTRIAEELKKKAPEGTEASTLHSLGVRAVKKAFGKDVILETHKSEKIFDKILKEEQKEDMFPLCQAVGMAKNILASTDKQIADLMEKYNISAVALEDEEFRALVLKCLQISKEKYKIIDFNDMIWLPYVHDLPVKYYNQIFIDEAQDINPAQYSLILKTLGTSGRCFIWGDPNQALYSFRGADPDIIPKFKNILDAETLTLPITYRCAKAIVEEAQQIVPSYKARSNAPQGEVLELDYQKMLETVKPGSFIISRTNAPLFRTAMRLLKNKTPCNIQGKDLQEQLLSIIRGSKTKKLTKFLVYLEKWYKTQIARNPKSAGYVTDKYESICALCEGLDTTKELIDAISTIFIETDDKDKVILGTTHALKGLERDTVYMFSNTYSTYNQDERNCKYVAITRAKNTLYMVEYQR